MKIKRTRRGQINIAETVVSATIILVLAISIAQVGTTIFENQVVDRKEQIKENATNSLKIGLDTGILRQLAYTNSSSPEFNILKNQMNNLISSSLPPTVQYALYQKTIDNSVDPLNDRTLLGVSPLPSGNLDIISISIFVGGYSDNIFSSQVAYIITLLIVIGD